MKFSLLQNNKPILTSTIGDALRTCGRALVAARGYRLAESKKFSYRRSICVMFEPVPEEKDKSHKKDEGHSSLCT